MSGPTTTIEGNITNDLDLRLLPSGKRVLNIGIAVTNGIRQSDGSFKDSTEYFETVCWDRLADNAFESLSKGQRVLVTGYLKQRSWNTPEGARRTAVELNVQGIGPSLRWATATVTKNPKLSAEQADAAGEAVVVAEQAPVEATVPAAVDPMAEPF